MKSTDDRRLFGTLIGASAATGNIATIPATQGTAGDGTASIALAFPPETFIARAAGGEPPRGADMNGFLNLLSSAVQVLQAGYLGPFDATFAAGIGGYPLNAVVADPITPGVFWVSTADTNITVPGASGAKWKTLFDGLATQEWATGSFATIQQLADETSARASADKVLQESIATEATVRATSVATRVYNVNYVKFTTSGTYTPSANMLFCKITTKGGGGGAGGALGGGYAISGGGGEGATAFGFFPKSALVGSITITVGAGGAGGAGGSGGQGGYSVAANQNGNIVAAQGGFPSGYATGSANLTAGGLGASAYAGTALTPGAPGGCGSLYSVVCSGSGGGGGAGPGIGLGLNLSTLNGINAVAGSGAGGGGAVSNNTLATGGSGGSGFVEIIEYLGG